MNLNCKINYFSCKNGDSDGTQILFDNYSP